MSKRALPKFTLEKNETFLASRSILCTRTTSILVSTSRILESRRCNAGRSAVLADTPGSMNSSTTVHPRCLAYARILANWAGIERSLSACSDVDTLEYRRAFIGKTVNDEGESNGRTLEDKSGCAQFRTLQVPRYAPAGCRQLQEMETRYDATMSMRPFRRTNVMVGMRRVVSTKTYTSPT